MRFECYVWWIGRHGNKCGPKNKNNGFCGPTRNKKDLVFLFYFIGKYQYNNNNNILKMKRKFHKY